MVNSLIPYSFIPGAKAKAQEVNENFIALANEIQDNKSDNILEFESINNRIDSVENNISTCISENISKNAITNCIIKYDEDIATYESNNITIKSGLSVLMSDGKTSDGNFKNKEYTLSEDVTITENWDGRYTAFLKDDGNIIYLKDEKVLKGTSTPSGTQSYNSAFYNIEENKWYYASIGNAFSETKIIPVLNFTGTSGVISEFRKNKILNILKNSDSAIISEFGYPSSNYIPITIGASGATYTAPANGWFNIWLEAQYIPNNYSNLAVNASSGLRIQDIAPAIGSGGSVCVICPCKKNDYIQIAFSQTAGVIQSRFYYAEGEVE